MALAVHCVRSLPQRTMASEFIVSQSSAISLENRSAPDEATPQTCTLHVCTSCRPAGTQREPQDRRAGFIFYQQLRDAVEESALRDRVDVRPAECLSICPRPCGLALSQPGAWTYLFGDQQPNETVLDVVNCVSLYLDSPDGFMRRKQRPLSMRSSILGRVPPREGHR